MDSLTNKYLEWPSNDEQIKVMQWQGENSIPVHKHEFVELVFIVKGSCIHTYQGTEVRLIPGDVFVITPHEEHSYTIDSPVQIYNCIFYPHALGENWQQLQNESNILDMLVVEPFFRVEKGTQEIMHLTPDQLNNIIPILHNMLSEGNSALPGFQLVQKANLTILLCMLSRARSQHKLENKKLYNKRRELLALALEYMEQNLQEDLHVDHIASLIYLSPSYFRKVFKEATGLSPINYINKLRISIACKLLKSEQPISEIAEQVGIQDYNYFSRLFKDLVGDTPSEYRKKLFCANFESDQPTSF